jgi:hypothetical protein
MEWVREHRTKLIVAGALLWFGSQVYYALWGTC